MKEAPPAPFDRQREILPLTGLRAVAAWAVVAFHFGRGPIESPLLDRLVGSGHVAVDLFFVLSGFVLAHRYAAEDVGPAGRRGFWVRRFARIYPLYVLSLVLGFAAEWPRSKDTFGTANGIARLVVQLAVGNAWWHRAMFRLNWAAWSLSVEVFFYAIFPWLLPWVARMSRRRLVVLLVICCGSAWIAPALYTALDPDHLGRPLALGDEVVWSWYLKFFPVQRLPELIAGAAASCLVRRAPRLPPNRAGATCAFAVVAFVLVVASAKVPYAYLQGGALLPLILLLVVGLEASERRGLIARTLGSRPVVALGHASYATYILHVPLFLLATRVRKDVWDGGWPLVAYALVLLVLSRVAHRFVEEPLRRRITAATEKRDLRAGP